MILKKVRGKNFFNIGNAFLEFDIAKHHTAVVGGKNGSGKSSLVNMITFALFNQTIKNVTKPQIVNSVNGKNCLVEIEFSANGKEYLVRRGVKPNVFEIIEDGVALNQSAATDFQEMLEKTILKTNFKTFSQTSVLSVENYKPFMSMRAYERRQFVEDILDIRVFTFMNQIVKQRLTKSKEELKILDIKLTSSKEKAMLQKKHLDRLQNLVDESTAEQSSKLQELTTQRDSKAALVLSMSSEVDVSAKELSSLSSRASEINNTQTKINKIVGAIEKISSDIESLHETGNCPTCKQDISDAPIFEEMENNRTRLKRMMSDLSETIKDGDDVFARVKTLSEVISSTESKIFLNQEAVISLDEEIQKLLDTDSSKINSKINEIAELKSDLRIVAKEVLDLRARQSEIKTDFDYLDTMIELFKDTGVKSKIVSQYIPIINQTINEYLDKLDFFVSFELDENFSEVIKSRHRDNFSYDSFSAGEKQRIDLALMFTFRKLAAIRNSIQCNMLFLDELMDASMDAAGIESMLKIFDAPELRQSNIIVISHRNRDVLEDAFEGSYEVYREQGFSQIRDVNESK